MASHPARVEWHIKNSLPPSTFQDAKPITSLLGGETPRPSGKKRAERYPGKSEHSYRYPGRSAEPFHPAAVGRIPYTAPSDWQRVRGDPHPTVDPEEGHD